MTGPKLVTRSNAEDMLAQETWSLTAFVDYSQKFSLITGRQVFMHVISQLCIIKCLKLTLAAILPFLQPTIHDTTLYNTKQYTIDYRAVHPSMNTGMHCRQEHEMRLGFSIGQ